MVFGVIDKLLRAENNVHKFAEQMTKQEHIDYWTGSAERDWKFIKQAFKIKQFVYALFFAHLVLEKLCKAHWVKDHQSNHPPKIHNLIYLIDNTQLKADAKERAVLEKMNTFQLEGRYPDYKNKLYKSCDKKFSETTLKEVKEIRSWLLNSL
ncbi:MAG: HEPN domain-containing protein [Bacteroidia bacterium]